MNQHESTTSIQVGVKDYYLWLQCPFCAAGAVQADALIHTIICGEIIAHLVAVATAFILCSAVSAALCLRRLLEKRPFKKKKNNHGGVQKNKTKRKSDSNETRKLSPNGAQSINPRDAVFSSLQYVKDSLIEIFMYIWRKQVLPSLLSPHPPHQWMDSCQAPQGKSCGRWAWCDA